MTFTLLLPLLALPLGGCIVAAAAAVAFGAISYTENEARMEVEQDLPTTFAAAKAAMRALSFPVDDTQVIKGDEGTLTSGEAKVVVARQPGGGSTLVRARVGTIDTDDNERRAKLILEEIKKRL